MDVRKWLDSVVLSEEPTSLPDQLGLPQFLHPKGDRKGPSGHAGASASARKRQSKNKQASSDSSLLQARKHHTGKNAVEHEAPINARANRASSPAPHRSHHSSSVSHAADQRYKRKPRHKTRPDLYEPKQEARKERESREHRRGQDESRKEKRKSRRKKTNNPGAGLVQSFHANNVPRERLTLKPREKVGIFNRGRASTPVKGRGLPDLVFSEMKFLQKRKDPPDESHEDEDMRKRRKKGHTHANEHEMSAYFTSLRPALAEKDTNVQSQRPPSHPHHSARPQTAQRQQRSTSIRSPIPTVEFPEKAYLGFGSRGARHESSYLSWSETDRLTQSPSFRPALKTIDIGQLKAAHRRPENADATTKSPPQPPTSFKSPERRSAVDKHQRSRVSSSLPVRFSPRPPSPHKRRPRSDTQNHTCRSVPETIVPESLVVAAPTRQERKRVTCRGRAAGSYTESRRTNDETLESIRAYRRVQTDSEGSAPIIVKTDPEPDTSSTMGRLLRDCEAAANERERWDRQQADRRPTVQFTLPRDGGERGGNIGREAQQAQATSHPALPAFTSQLRQLPNQAFPTLFEQHLQHDYGERQWDDYDDTNMGNIHSILRAGRQMENYHDRLSYLPDRNMTTELGHGQPIDGAALGHGASGQQQSAQEEDGIFASFWRSHKLY